MPERVESTEPQPEGAQAAPVAPARAGHAPLSRSPRTPAAVLALQQAAGNAAVSRLMRAPVDNQVPAGVTLPADPLPQGANTADPRSARVADDASLGGGWTDRDGQQHASGRVGAIRRIRLDNLREGNQRQQGAGHAGANARGLSDAAGGGPARQRARAIALVPDSVATAGGGAAGGAQPAAGGSSEIAVIVHFHGIGAGVREEGDNPTDVEDYQMEQQLEAFMAQRQGARAIVLMPVGITVGQGPYNASFGGLNVDSFISECFGRLGGNLPSGAQPGTVFLSAHSAGGFTLSGMMARGGMPQRLGGIMGFESFHGGDIATWISFVRGKLNDELASLQLQQRNGQSQGLTPEEIFTLQGDRLRNEGFRFTALAGGGYAGRARQIRTAILQWFSRNAAQLRAATDGRTEILDLLWANYQAQFFPGSNHRNALATSRDRFGRALSGNAAQNRFGRALANLPNFGALAGSPPAPAAGSTAPAPAGGAAPAAPTGSAAPAAPAGAGAAPAGAGAAPAGAGAAPAAPAGAAAPATPAASGGGGGGGGGEPAHAPAEGTPVDPGAEAQQAAAEPATAQPATAQPVPAGAPGAPAGAPAAAPAFPRERYAMSTDEATIITANRRGRRRIAERVDVYTAEILTAAGQNPQSWYGNFTSGVSFLGRPIVDPIHVLLAEHLRRVEGPLAQAHGNGDAAAAGQALGLNEDIIGARRFPTSSPVSMHLFGLAIDVNYTANPFIGTSANPVFNNAGLLVDGRPRAYRDGMRYAQLAELDRVLTTYFGYLNDDAALQARLQAATVAPWRGATPATARQQIERDLTTVTTRWSRTRTRQVSVIRSGGFMDMRQELVDGIGLSWGGAYGDMMHFDMRNVAGPGARISAAARAYKRRREREASTPAAPAGAAAP